MQDIKIDSTKDITIRLVKERKWLVASSVIFGLLTLLLLPPIGLFFLMFPFIYFYIKAHKEFMRNFAAANGMTYAEKGSLEKCRGRLFEVGHTKRVTNVISGTWNDFPMKMFNYSYTVSSGKSSNTYSFTVLEISFQNIKFPFIFLKSKSMWQGVSPFHSDLEVSLHSDKFRLFTTEGYAVETLQIFSESLLQYLSLHAPKFCIEFSGNKINIYDDKTIGNKKDLKQLLDAGRHIVDSSGAFILRLRDDFAALHSYYSKAAN